MTARTIVDDDKFAELWRQGATYIQISHALGIREDKINAIRTRLGLPTRRSKFVDKATGAKSRTDTERNATIVALRAKGAMIPDLAAQFNLTAQRIRVILRDRERIEAFRKPKPTIRSKAEITPRAGSRQPSGDGSRAAPALPPHPFWTTDHDAALLQSKGTHGDLAALAVRWGKTCAFVRARWHRVRGA